MAKGYAQSALADPVIVSMCAVVVSFCGYVFELMNAPIANLKRFGLVSLIGRDILQFGTLQYAGTEANWSFEIPGFTAA